MLVSCSLRTHAKDKHGFKASQSLQRSRDPLCGLDGAFLSCSFPSVGFSKTGFKN